MKCDLWKVVGEEKYVGSQEQLAELNRRSGNQFVINGDEAIKIFNDEVEPLIMQSTTKPKLITQKITKKKVENKKKVVNVPAVNKDGEDINLQVREAEPVEPMPMPAVVGNDNNICGYGSPSMIRTGEEDFVEKLHDCTAEQEQEGNVPPKVVGD